MLVYIFIIMNNLNPTVLPHNVTESFQENINVKFNSLDDRLSITIIEIFLASWSIPLEDSAIYALYMY